MTMKQNNFYLQYQQAAKADKTAARSALLRKAAPGVIIVAGCLLVWLGITIHTLLMRGQTADLTAWCQDETNLTPYLQSLQDQQAADAYQSLTDYSNGITDILNSYPDLTSSLLNRIEAVGSASGISVEFTSYDATTGLLQFNATSDTVIDIPSYVRALQDCGVFASVDYTGYQYNNNTSDTTNAGYALNLRCVLAAPQ